jgi:hypothetical protein
VQLRPLLAVLAVVSALALTASGAASPASTRTAPFGSTFTVRGLTGGLPGSGVRANGIVIVRGRWQGERVWHFIRATRTVEGRYSVTFKPSRRGTLTVDVLTPDRRVVAYVLRIV